MPRTFTVECGPDDYQFTASTGEISTAAEYGENPAVLSIDGDIYYCLIEDQDAETADVFKVDSVSKMATKVEDVEFEEDDEPIGPVLVDTEDAG